MSVASAITLMINDPNRDPIEVLIDGNWLRLTAARTVEISQTNDDYVGLRTLENPDIEYFMAESQVLPVRATDV